MSPKPFAVRIFLADGTVDGVKVIAKSKWTGRGVVLPRVLLAAELSREELQAPGIIILIGPTQENDRPTLLIEAAAAVAERLQQLAVEQENWDWALVSTAKKEPLSPASTTYLAARLQQLAAAAKRAELLSLAPVVLPELAAAEQDAAEAYLEHLAMICPLLGLTAFEPSQD